jgi:hypothetical protein
MRAATRSGAVAKAGAAAVGAAVALAALATAPPALAHGGTRSVDVRDECDPVSFAEVPGGCAAELGGDVTLDELFTEISTRTARVLSRRDALGWRFSSDTTLRHGEALGVTSHGGEVHSFTRVNSFGGGCVPEINHAMGLEEHPQCTSDTDGVNGPDWLDTLVPAGSTALHPRLAKGTHHFECLIHPWMRVTVTVR